MKVFNEGLLKGLIKRIINDNILSEGLKWDNLDEYWEFRRFGHKRREWLKSEFQRFI